LGGKGIKWHEIFLKIFTYKYLRRLSEPEFPLGYPTGTNKK
jgi:hypothetical protein